MRAIHKFSLIGHKTQLALPPGSVVRHVHEQNGEVMLWIEKDLEHPTKVIRSFIIEGTGQPFEGERTYLGTAHVGFGVWHVFEVPA